MSTDPFRKSIYDDGNLVGDDWFCGCGEKAPWRTAKKDAYKDMKFLRCPRIGNGQCSFIIWEEDEPEARQKKSSGLPPLPQTPVRQRVNPVSLPTPTSNVSGSRTSRTALPQPLDMSPTPRRFRDVEAKDYEDEDLSTTVLELLRSENVQLRSSTESTLRHKIEMAVDVYETRLRRSNGTISELRKKLDELERDHATS